jgi:hypothetical protein
MYPMLRTLNPWHSGVQVGRVLKEIQVAPDLLLGVVHRAFLTANRAREVTPLGEIDVQIQALLFHRKPHIVYGPRRNQPQCQREELLLLNHLYPQIPTTIEPTSYPHYPRKTSKSQ